VTNLEPPGPNDVERILNFWTGLILGLLLGTSLANLVHLLLS
jgi:hypothetical protein